MSVYLLYPKIWQVFKYWRDECGIDLPDRDTYQLPVGPNWSRINKFLETLDDEELVDFLSGGMVVDSEVAQYSTTVLGALGSKHGAY